jgi:hypothetical protein
MRFPLWSLAIITAANHGGLGLKPKRFLEPGYFLLIGVLRPVLLAVLA